MRVKITRGGRGIDQFDGGHVAHLAGPENAAEAQLEGKEHLVQGTAIAQHDANAVDDMAHTGLFRKLCCRTTPTTTTTIKKGGEG